VEGVVAHFAEISKRSSGGIEKPAKPLEDRRFLWQRFEFQNSRIRLRNIAGRFGIVTGYNVHGNTLNIELSHINIRFD
jgi:hypothetical protein